MHTNVYVMYADGCSLSVTCMSFHFDDSLVRLAFVRMMLR